MYRDGENTSYFDLLEVGAEKKHACVPIERGQGAMDPDRIFLQLIEKALKSPDPYFTLYLTENTGMLPQILFFTF